MTMSVDELAKALSGSIYHVEFNKADGTLRKMRATRMSAYIPLDKAPKHDPHVLTTAVPAFDLDLKEWRSIRPDSIVKMEAAQ